MNKQEFLSALRKGLADFSEEEIKEYIDFYSEMIDDRTEEGLTEEEAVADIGPVQDVIDKIIIETPLPTLVKTKLNKEHKLKGWHIALIVIGSPIWLSLLVSLFSVVFSVAVAIFSVIIALYAVNLSLAACTIGGILATIPMIICQNPMSALASLGMGLFCAGGAILMFLGLSALTKAMGKLSKKFMLWIKSLFIKKERI